MLPQNGGEQWTFHLPLIFEREIYTWFRYLRTWQEHSFKFRHHWCQMRFHLVMKTTKKALSANLPWIRRSRCTFHLENW